MEFLRFIRDHEVFADEVALILESMHFKQPRHFPCYTINLTTSYNVFGNGCDVKALYLLLMTRLQSINLPFYIFAINLDRIEKDCRLVLPIIMPKRLFHLFPNFTFYLGLLFVEECFWFQAWPHLLNFHIFRTAIYVELWLLISLHIFFDK